LERLREWGCAKTASLKNSLKGCEGSGSKNWFWGGEQEGGKTQKRPHKLAGLSSAVRGGVVGKSGAIREQRANNFTGGKERLNPSL